MAPPTALHGWLGTNRDISDERHHHTLGHVCGQCGSVLAAQCMFPSRAAPGCPAVPPSSARGAMRQPTLTIAAQQQQQQHCSLGRSIKDTCADDCISVGSYISRKKTDWLKIQEAADCESNGTYGSKIRSVVPVYR